MYLRYIFLDCEYGYPSVSFSTRFRANSNFINDYLSKAIRKIKSPAPDDFNMICVRISSQSSIRLVPEKSLLVEVPVKDAELIAYQQMRKLEDRYEFCLALLERGYQLASLSYDLPYKQLMDLNEHFRQIGYRDEWLIKQFLLRQHGIRVSLTACFTVSDFHVILNTMDIKSGSIITEKCIIQTDPYWECFDKDIRNVHIENNEIIIEDFLGNVNITISLSELISGNAQVTYSSKFANELKEYEGTIPKLIW